LVDDGSGAHSGLISIAIEILIYFQTSNLIDANPNPKEKIENLTNKILKNPEVWQTIGIFKMQYLFFVFHHTVYYISLLQNGFYLHELLIFVIH
jgi:hypothetical protein